MSKPDKPVSPLSLAEAMAILMALPENNKEGFLNIAEHMGNFTGVFATGASRATAVRERMNSAGEFGLATLKTDMNRTFREIGTTITALDSMAGKNTALLNRLAKAVEWGYSLEQDAILPPISDQIKVKSGDALELQSLASILDNLLHQIRPLIAELISGCQQTHALISHLNRRMVADLESSRQGLQRLKKQTQHVLTTMTHQVGEISIVCRDMEKRSQTVNAMLGELVQAMQYDDITAQRVSHAVITLGQVEEKMLLLSQQENLRPWVVLAMRIVVDQLEESSADLVTALQTIQHELTRISDHAVDQAKGVQQLRGVGLDFRQAVAELTHHLNSALRLGIFDEGLPGEFLRVVSQAENGIFQAKRAMSAIALSAGRMENLAGSLRNRGNERMQILTGTILELSHRVQQEKDTVQLELTSAAESLHQISNIFMEQVMPILMRNNAMLRRMPLSVQQVDNHNTDNLAALADNLAEAQSTVIQIMLLAAEMTFHVRFKKQVQKVVEGLQEMIHEYSGGKDLEGDLASLAAEFQDLAALYTMDSERRILQQALNLDSDATPAPPAEDDGFELF
ncbi:MAG: hypothetical protein HQL55_12790 [Magnetococcales bacterium]|nr:hypothetical protein [Magnetococcales bacterium]